MTTQTSPNPANPPETVAQQPGLRRRIPMSVPTRKLEATDIPGYHLHWFVDRNVGRAIQGGYEFVDSSEVTINQHGVGNNTEISGNADLGSRVRVVAGEGPDGKGEYLTLMKIKEEFFQEDQKALAERNASVLAQIFRGETVASPAGNSPKQSQSDESLRYVDTAKTSFQKPLFQRPARKSR